MSQVAKDLRTFLGADATIATLVGAAPNGRIHQNHVPQDKAFPFVWYAQSGLLDGDVLAEAAGSAPYGREFDVECVSDDVDKAVDLAEAVRNRLRNFRGVIASTREVQAIFCDEHSEDYVPRGNEGDIGLHVESLRATVIPR